LVRWVYAGTTYAGAKQLMERRTFFSASIDQEDVEKKARSPQEIDRWFAAVALAQIHEPWAFDLLKMLKSDNDESTRVAAVNALRAFPVEFFDASLDGSREDSDFVPGIWKIRPLPSYDSNRRDIFLAAIVDIVGTEGSVTGGRIQSRLTGATSINSGKKVGKSLLKSLLDELIGSNVLTRADSHLDSDDVELWIVHAPGMPEFVIRGRDGRDITEIPVNEAKAVLLDNRVTRRNPANRDAGFRVLMEQYDIKPNEFFLVGEAMEHQWQTLFLVDQK
jgi:hypothetical protein